MSLISICLTTLVLTCFAPAKESRHRIPAGSGVVQGRVVDARDRPVAGIKVYAEREGPDGIMPVIATNKRGRFSLKLLSGKYRLFVVTENAGSDLSWRLFNVAPWIANIVVHDGRVTGGIILRWNLKQARIIGIAKDADTGGAVMKTGMLICLVDAPSACVETSIAGVTPRYQTFRRIVPA